MPWKLAVMVGGMRRSRMACIHLLRGLAQREAGPQVERDGHGRQLAEVVDVAADPIVR